jgi:hypothetical protein
LYEIYHLATLHLKNESNIKGVTLSDCFRVTVIRTNRSRTNFAGPLDHYEWQKKASFALVNMPSSSKEEKIAPYMVKSCTYVACPTQDGVFLQDQMNWSQFFAEKIGFFSLKPMF